MGPKHAGGHGGHGGHAGQGGAHNVQAQVQQIIHLLEALHKEGQLSDKQFKSILSQLPVRA